MVHDPRVTQQLSRLGGLYRDPARVDRDAASLLKSSVGSHLAPIAAEMVENNGNTSTVLVLQGTVAIHFRGNTYQLLLDIYLPAGYPQRPPVAYVRLAENMYLKENHRHVGSDGKVFLPYLHNWNPQTHNLVELVVAMSSVFSADPPVFSRAPMASNSVASTVSSSSGQSRQQQQAQQEAMLAREAEEANRAAEAARRAEREEQAQRIRIEQERVRKEQDRARQEEERKAQLSAQRAWEEARTQQVREQVNEKVQRYLREQSKQTQQQVQSDWRDQQRLSLAAEQKIEAQLKLYQEQKRELERLLSLAEQAREDITNWLEEYETKDDTTVKEVSADDMVQPASQLHDQMLNLSAENAAISDALYFLDKALYKGNLSLQDHLKQVRKLAKRQFLVRAHLIKINQVLLDRGSSRKLNGGKQYRL